MSRILAALKWLWARVKDFNAAITFGGFIIAAMSGTSTIAAAILAALDKIRWSEVGWIAALLAPTAALGVYWQRRVRQALADAREELASRPPLLEPARLPAGLADDPHWKHLTKLRLDEAAAALAGTMPHLIIAEGDPGYMLLRRMIDDARSGALVTERAGVKHRHTAVAMKDLRLWAEKRNIPFPE